MIKLDRNRYTMQEIAAMIGRTSRYVSMWIILRPSLKIVYKRQEKGKARHNIFDRENAEKFLNAYEHRERYHQEYDAKKEGFHGIIPDTWEDPDFYKLD